jgi:dUTPase
MLSKHEIAKAQLVLDADLQPISVSGPGFREGTYDLTIGKIFPCKGDSCETFELKPGGIVHVVSAEIVRLPADIVGLAHVKTGLCNAGLLALNIGVVDPNWSNCLGSAILNFSNAPWKLKTGDQFLRLSFHRFASPDGMQVDATSATGSAGAARVVGDANPPGATGAATIGDDYQRSEHRAYVSEVGRRAASKFTGSFLNIEALVEDVAQKQRKYVRNTILVWGSIAAVMLALLTVVITIGISWGVRTIEQPPADLKGTLQLLEEQNRFLQDRIKSVEEASQALRRDGAQLGLKGESTQAPPENAPANAKQPQAGAKSAPPQDARVDKLKNSQSNSRQKQSDKP